MDDLISIIVPVYKIEEEVLKNCLESILKQSYVNIEIVIIDDGSPDQCGLICDEYMSKDDRIRVIHTKNGGVSRARNIGLENSSGDYIMFVDSDDYIACDFVENMYRESIEKSVNCVISGCTKIAKINAIDESKEVYEWKVIDQKLILESLFYMKQPYSPVELTSVWGTLYSKELIGDMRFNEEMKIGEDFEFKYRVFQKTDKVLCLSLHDYYYYMRPNSAIRSRFDQTKFATLFELEEIINLNKGSCIEKGITSRCINIAIVLLLMIPINSDLRKERYAIIKFIKKYRRGVILNPKTRSKVRWALLMSYFSFNTMQKVFQLMQKQ